MNRLLAADSPDAPKKGLGWNPFQRLESEQPARSAARSGAIVSGWLALSYLIQVAFAYAYNQDTFGNEGSITLVMDVIGVVLATFLTWRISAAQPLWASVVVAVWYYIELFLKFAAIASGQQKTNAGWIIMFLALFTGSILSIRGSWKLRRLRRAAAALSTTTGIETTQLESGNPANSGLGADPQLRPTISELQPTRSYFIRHWRGELSLPVSYWVNNFLGYIVVFAIFVSVTLAIDVTEHSVIFALTVSIAWLLAIAISIWQLVGVWRSAGNHKARGGRGFWAGAARCMVILGSLSLASTLSTQTLPQIAEFWRVAAGDSDIGKYELHILRGGTELEFAGGITFGAADEVRKLLDTDPSIRVIHLNSRGGRVAEARKLRDLVRERMLVTYTASGCASACTIAFMGGVQRFIAPEAKLGFHRGSFPGMSDAELAQENEVDRRWLIGIGVSAWFADRAYSTPSDSMWWPTSDELRRAGVITGVARPDDLASSDFGGAGVTAAPGAGRSPAPISPIAQEKCRQSRESYYDVSDGKIHACPGHTPEGYGTMAPSPPKEGAF